ncbi:GntR family transcriptional regulator [Nocardioides sp. L-11A]|uniref:GntR family transcriptional regulator n=1 Tax=Nocardioides sp. L-11A TaxID=3043848 RepID=UPI002499B3CB|nr:GntR family transcriptional regulator [Nocardioides sp. L-11A]
MDLERDIDAYEAIRASIVDDTLRAGHRLIEADLALALNTSRSYVRQALARLEFEGLVDKAPGHSATVRRVPKAEILEIIEARIALEAIVVRAAAARRTDAQARQLLDAARTLEAKFEKSDISGVLEAQAAFHHMVLEAGRKPAIQRVVHNLAALTVQTRMRSMLLPGRIPASVKEHAAIAAAVVAQDADAAERAMVAHLRSVAHAVSKLPDSVHPVSLTPRKKQEVTP